MLLVVLHVVPVACCFLVIMLQCSTNNHRSWVKTLLKRMATLSSFRIIWVCSFNNVHRFQDVFYAILYISSLMFMYCRNKSIVKATHTTNQKSDISIMYLLHTVCFKEGIIIKVNDSNRTNTGTFIEITNKMHQVSKILS